MNWIRIICFAFTWKNITLYKQRDNPLVISDDKIQMNDLDKIHLTIFL